MPHLPNSSALRRNISLPVLVVLSIVLSGALSGCGVAQTLFSQPSAIDSSAEATQVAVQLTLWALASAQPGPVTTTTPVSLPTYTIPPTYTPLPTYTPFPTFTPIPTFTPLPSMTLPPPNQPVAPTQPAAPTQTPLAGVHPYTLRVRNHFRSTYWIGARMPYGGNFIKPLWYVEFYPPEPTWIRVWYCRYSSYFYTHWDNSEWQYYQQYWVGNSQWDDRTYWDNHNSLYNCNCRDVYVDEAFIEISVP